MLLSGQVPYRTNSSQLLKWTIPEKKIKKLGGGGRGEETLVKRNRGFFCFFSVSMEISGKAKIHPGYLVKLCMINPSEISRLKNQDP